MVENWTGNRKIEGLNPANFNWERENRKKMHLHAVHLSISLLLLLSVSHFLLPLVSHSLTFVLAHA